MKSFIVLLVCLATLAAAETFQEFDQWFSTWEQSAESDIANDTLALDGFDLAVARQQIIVDMVAAGEYQEAYDLMESGSFYDERLPLDILSNVEYPFNCVADVEVLHGVRVSESGDSLEGLDTATTTMTCKSGDFDGITCEAFSAGDRVTGEANVIGFALNAGDETICVLAATACRPMSARAAAKAFVPEGKVGAICGGDTMVFESQEEYEEYASYMSQAEDQAANQAALSKTTGAAKMLVIPTYFSDETGPCSSKAEYQKAFDIVEGWFKTNSFGKLTYEITVANPRKMPFPKAKYSSGLISTEARKGINTNGYDNVMIAHTKANVGWAGLGQLGGSITWINGFCDGHKNINSFFFMVVEHELGHNFGLHHAGRKVTYDDKYAIMGNQCRFQKCHFQGANKWYMKWSQGRVDLGTGTTLPKRNVVLNAIDDSRGAVHVATFTIGSTFYTADHASFFSGDVCVIRSRTNSLRSMTKVVHYMVPNQEYKIGSNTFKCSARSGTGVATRVTLMVNGGGVPPTPPPPTPPTPPTPPPPTPPCSGKVDKYTMCGGWKSKKYCTQYQFVRDMCTKSCCNDTTGPKYLGCWKDTGSRAMSKAIGRSHTVETCRTKCDGFTYFAIQHGNYCFCGNSFNKYGRAEEAKCLGCKANNKYKCGGGWLNSVYMVKNAE